MKNFLLLPFLVLLAACSTEDSALEPGQENEYVTDAQYRTGTPVIMPDCNLGINGSVYADLSNGIQNPIAVFVADLTGGNPRLIYKVTLEIETLSDCEDINSGTGSITGYPMLGYAIPPFTISPEVRVNGSALPANQCYRWRFVIEGMSGPYTGAICVTTSEWYDAPLI